MKRIKLRPDTQASNWKAALPLLGLAALGAAVFAHAAPAAKTAEYDVAAVADFTTCKRPEYPAESSGRKDTGTVTLGFLVGTDGKVQETNIRKSSGHRPLDDAARTALAKCTFKPATLKGEPVQAWTYVQYVWTLD